MAKDDLRGLRLAAEVLATTRDMWPKGAPEHEDYEEAVQAVQKNLRRWFVTSKVAQVGDLCDEFGVDKVTGPVAAWLRSYVADPIMPPSQELATRLGAVAQAIEALGEFAAILIKADQG